MCIKLLTNCKKTLKVRSKLLTTLVILTIIPGCNRKVVTPTVTLHDSTSTNVKVVKEIKEVQLPPDSAWLKALLMCDSIGNVYLTQIESLQGERVIQNLNLDNNTLNVKATDTGRKTEKLEKTDSVATVYREKPVNVPYPVYTNKLTQWQIFQMWLGRIAAVALLVFFIYKWLKGKLSIISKLFNSKSKL